MPGAHSFVRCYQPASISWAFYVGCEGKGARARYMVASPCVTSVSTSHLCPYSGPPFALGSNFMQLKCDQSKRDARSTLQRTAFEPYCVCLTATRSNTVAVQFVLWELQLSLFKQKPIQVPTGAQRAC
jgi:hypothetical protein